MKSIISVDALTWLGGFAAQTFLKAFFVLLVLNGFIDLLLIRILEQVSSPFLVITGLTACLYLAWLYLLWKIEPPILSLSILGVLPLLIGAGVFLVTGNLLWLLIVIIGYVGWTIWWNYFRAPALRAAMQQWHVGNVGQAISVLDRYIASHPAVSEAYQYRAWFRLDRSQYPEAEQDIQAALRLKPRSYFSHYVYGQILLRQGRIGEAKESFKTAVRLGPGRGISYLPLGIIYHLEAEPLLAVEAFCNGIGWKLPDALETFVSYYYLGRNLDAMGQSAAAERAYRLMSRYSEEYEWLLSTYQDGNDPETPTSKLYRSDLPDMGQRLNLDKTPN
jgi:tetratricopeptide (TPR) repeat protein